MHELKYTQMHKSLICIKHEYTQMHSAFYSGAKLIRSNIQTCDMLILIHKRDSLQRLSTRIKVNTYLVIVLSRN